MVDTNNMDTECLTEFLKTKDISLDDFKKMDPESEEYKKAYDGFEKYQEEWKEKAEKENEEKGKEKPSENKSIAINEGEASSNKENTQNNTNEEKQEANWKQEFYNEWGQWSKQEKLLMDDVNAPDKEGDLSFRFYDSEEKKGNGEFSAEISYSSPNNMSIKGYQETIPDIKYFEKAVELATSKGNAIEFGNIKTPEFKAKLLAACYLKGASFTNAPSNEEMAKWPDDLKKMVAEAKAKAEKEQQQEKPQEKAPEKTEEKPKEETKEISAAAAKIAELRNRIGQRNESLKEAEEAALAAGGELRQEDKDAISKEGMSAEELKLRELRGQAKGGDKKAGHELDKRRYQTMTDEYKYEREVEVDEKGNAKTDENGKPVYKKDKDGNFVYKTNDKGQKIKTPEYQAFLTKAGNNLSRQ